MTRGPSYRMARGCARVGTRGLSFTSRGFARMHADHRLGHESRIGADGRGSPALGHESRICADGRGSPAAVTRVADLRAMHADHRLGSRVADLSTVAICADARGSPARSRVADLRGRCTRITGSVTSCGFAPMHADHQLGHESRICADARGSLAWSRVADLRRWSRITGSVTSRGCARIAIGDSECRSESTLPLASLILQRPSRGSVAIPPYSRIGNRRKTNVLGWPDACDTWPA